LASETNYTLNATTHQWKRQLAAEAAAEAARACATERVVTRVTMTQLSENFWTLRLFTAERFCLSTTNHSPTAAGKKCTSKRKPVI